MSVLRYGLGLTLGRLARLHDVQLVIGREISVRGPSAQPVQTDGDIVTYLPLHIAIDPTPVRLLYPA